MLRITREPGSGDRARLRLEGAIDAEWAHLLERECSALLRAGIAVCLDLTRVGLVGRKGIDTLARLDRAGVEIRCHSGAVAAVLEAEGVRIVRSGAAANGETPGEEVPRASNSVARFGDVS